MRLKSLHISVTNQRIKRTCIANIFMLYLLSLTVWCYANIEHSRFVRQLNAETAVNYEDFAMTNSYHQPHFTGNRTVVVQLFEWKFVDVAAECRDFLGPQGYAAVQLSPVLEHTVVKSAELNHPWWERYEVVSYRLASRSGDEAEFWSMSRICNEHGIRIYADVVLNHMAAPLHSLGVNGTDSEDFIINTLLEKNVNISQQNYSNVSYTQRDFHRPICMVLDNAQDAHEIRNCQLNGHPDLDHAQANVQKHIVEMLNKFVDMGVAGFRLDAAKYMWPIDLKNILSQVKNLSTEFNFKKNSRPFIYHDVFDLGFDTVSKTEYSTYGVVSEYLYPVELSTILSGKVPLSSLINWGPALGFLPHEDSLVFIDSHDTQRGLPVNLGYNHVLTYKNRFKYIMANVFMLLHPYGNIKRIMSSFYFSEDSLNQGPPVLADNEEEIRSPEFKENQQCTKESGWVCEHRWPPLVHMLKVANYFKASGNTEASVIHFQTNGPNQVAFCRGYKAFVAINNDPDLDFIKEIYACLRPGLYCDVLTGGKKPDKEECRGQTLEINEHGYMKLALNVADGNGQSNEEDIEFEQEQEEEEGKIESYGIVVIYVESKIEPRGKGPTDAKASSKTDKEIGTQSKEISAEANNEDNGFEGGANEPTDHEASSQIEEENETPSKEISAEANNEDNGSEGGANEPTDPEASSQIKEENETQSKEISAEANNEGNGSEDGVDEPKDAQESSKTEEESETQPKEISAEANNEDKGSDDGVDEPTDAEASSKTEEETETESKEMLADDNNEDNDSNNNEDEEESSEKEESDPGEVNNEDSGDDVEQKAEDMEQNETTDETNTEQEGEKETGEEKSASAENDLEDEENLNNQTDNEEENPEENNENDSISTNEEANEVSDSNEIMENKEAEEENPTNEEEVLNENDGNEEADEIQDSKEVKENSEQEANEENDLANETEEANAEEENSKNEEIDLDSKENTPEEDKTEQDEPEQADLVKENPADSQTDATLQELDEETQQNQSRNLDASINEAEEQIEKPSAEFVDKINDSTEAVTAKIQDIQTAGFSFNPKGNGHNG